MSGEDSDHEIQQQDNMGHKIPGKCVCHYKPRVCGMSLWKFLFVCIAATGFVYLNKHWIIPTYCPSLSNLFSSFSSAVYEHSGRDHRRPKIIPNSDSDFQEKLPGRGNMAPMDRQNYPLKSSLDSHDDKGWEEIVHKLDSHRESPIHSSKPEKDQQLPNMLLDIPPSPPRYNISQDRIVFLKTHRTGSSTAASLFRRYGYNHNLLFALPKMLLAKDFLQTMKFKRSFIYEYPGVPQQKYDILANNARYDRKEMEFVVPDATFITILRKPEDQLESLFGFHNVAEELGLTESPNPFEMFVDRVELYYQMKFKYRDFFKNGQLFDLGMDEKDMHDERKTYAKIQSLEEEFDLVLICEYFDESLILLKKLLGWKDEDILYISSRIRSDNSRYDKSDIVTAKIRQWNKGDTMLYKHFNKTLWWRIGEYGPSFEEDLARFRKKNQEVFDDCVDVSKYDSSDKRLKRYVLRNSAGSLCRELIRTEFSYSKLIRQMMGDRHMVV